jgi:hypothetical protein
MRGAVGLLAAWSLAAVEICSTDCRSKSLAAFLDVERVARRSEADQRDEIPRLYREVYPKLRGYLAHLQPYGLPIGEGLTVEQLAERIEQEAGWGWLAEGARRRARDVLGRHRGLVVRLVREDFETGGPEALDRAVRTVGDLRLWELLNQTVHVLQTGPEELADAAAYALRDLNDPRAIEPLIRKDPQRPTKYLELLRCLQRNRPPHPLLVNLLKSGNATVRRQAAYALEEAASRP